MTGDELYGLPLKDFVAQRTALARALRQAGERDEAAGVAKLPKPTVAAWAANQVLRTQRADAKELFAAGDALAGASAATLRDAITRQREAVDTLLDAARGLLDPDGRGLSDTTLERVQQTLHAASLDPRLREDAEAGRLVKEHVFTGLPEKVAEAKKAKPAARKKPAQPRPDPKQKAYEARLRKAEEAAARAAAELDELRRSGPA